jgi:hypothetical protein
MTGEQIVEINGEEVPAWLLDEIQEDPWSPGETVAPGLSTPQSSEFKNAPSPTAKTSSELSPSTRARALSAYQQLQPTSTSSTAQANAFGGHQPTGNGIKGGTR